MPKRPIYFTFIHLLSCTYLYKVLWDLTYAHFSTLKAVFQHMAIAHCSQFTKSLWFLDYVCFFILSSLFRHSSFAWDAFLSLNCLMDSCSSFKIWLRLLALFNSLTFISICSIFHSLMKYSLGYDSVSYSLLGIGDATRNKTNPYPRGAYVLVVGRSR